MAVNQLISFNQSDYRWQYHYGWARPLHSAVGLTRGPRRRLYVGTDRRQKQDSGGPLRRLINQHRQNVHTIIPDPSA